MATTRNGDFLILDYTGMFEVTDRVHHLVGDLGLFTEEPQITTTAQVERVDESVSLIEARLRGGERQFVGSEAAQLQSFIIPFFPLDKPIQAQDIQNFRLYGTADAPKTVAAHVLRVMNRIRRHLEQLKERARIGAIMGTSFEGVGVTPRYNYYTVWGQTQATANVDFTDVATNPAAVIEAQARRHIVDNAGDNGSEYGIIALCGSQWFSAFIAHPLIENAYNYYQSQEEPLRRRLGLNGNENAINRAFKHQGVLYIEDISGYIPTGEAYILPDGMPEMFSTYYAPADDIHYANQMAETAYLWYKELPGARQGIVESESSFLCVNKRPELVVKSTGTF